MEQTSNKRYTLLICTVLTLVTFVAFAPLRHSDFVNFDDTKYVTENPQVQAGLSRDNVIWAFTTGYFANWHPLTWLSHMLDCELFGLNAGWHHLTNLFLHMANTLLLFAVLKRMTGALWRSAFVAAAFALHPLHVESVAWISERKDVLSTLFWLLTMAAYMRYVKRPGIFWYLLTLLVFALGLMAKPMLVTLPFVLLLLDYWPLDRFQLDQVAENGDDQAGGDKPLRARFKWSVISGPVREKIPFFLVSALSSVVTFLAQQSWGVVVPISKFPLKVRIANAFLSYIRYIVQMVYPSELAIIYPHPGAATSMWKASAAALLLVIISGLVIWLARSRKYLPVGWFWYLGTLVPVIGLVQVGPQALANRYTYVPLIGLFIIIAWALGDLLTKWRYRKIMFSASGLTVLLILAILTRLQVNHWRNSFTLFEHTLKVTKDNYMAHHCLAEPLSKQGKFDEAIKHYSEALRIRPDAAKPHNGMGIALLAKGRFDQAVPHFLKALESERNSPEIYNNLGIIFLKQGKFDEAIACFNDSLQLEPDYVKAHNGIGMAFLAKGRFAPAVTHFTRALEINPYFAHPHRNLAKAFLHQGKLNQAVEHYTRALQLRPDWIDPMNSLAWLMATHKDAAFYNPQQAVSLARRACEITGYANPSFLDTLAAAYAAAGRFGEAVTTAEKALKLALSSKQTKLAERIRKHLDLYKAGEPYVEP